MVFYGYMFIVVLFVYVGKIRMGFVGFRNMFRFILFG